ncbi:MFS general substrate transporter [Penicillium odoratum]|uniref:MFS general substrate transporter n=1 Tax=Penicillium odoratum TaxID=1167516 RepID=UPI0025471983|nr:MFS general substrate transporter [Penicillium odoratum]KAJ5772470.1 MFS general substrate transporter [Penicillium odoratum]
MVTFAEEKIQQNNEECIESVDDIELCWLACLGTWNTAAINSAYSFLAEDLGISEVQASYQTTIVIALNGVGPFVWIPLANVYGRRFVYLLTTFIGFATALGCGFTHSFGALVGLRAINGIFPVSMALGPATVTDLFFYHQRGRALETMYYKPRTYSDSNAQFPKLSMAKYRELLRPWTSFPGVKLKAKHFIIPPFRMALYPSVLFPSLYYASQYCFTAIFPAVTYAIIFKARFGWSALQCGLAYGGTMTIGAIIGEFAAGMIIDDIVHRESIRLGVDSPPPEVRFKGIWTGAALIPAGLLIFGFTIQYNSHWSGPLAGMFIGIFGVQVVATVCYTYSIDSYRVEGSEVSQFFNFCRQSTSCTVAFYGVKLCTAIGFQFAFIMFALVGSVVAFAPVVWLMWRGAWVREKLGKPVNVSVVEEIISRHHEFHRMQG